MGCDGANHLWSGLSPRQTATNQLDRAKDTIFKQAASRKNLRSIGNRIPFVNESCILQNGDVGKPLTQFRHSSMPAHTSHHAATAHTSNQPSKHFPLLKHRTASNYTTRPAHAPRAQRRRIDARAAARRERVDVVQRHVPRRVQVGTC